MNEPQDLAIEARERVTEGCPCGTCKILRQLADEIERLRKQIKTMQRDAREDAQAAANEARWQERQGEDYGSY